MASGMDPGGTQHPSSVDRVEPAANISWFGLQVDHERDRDMKWAWQPRRVAWEWRRAPTSAVMHANVIFVHRRGLPGAAGPCGQANLRGPDIRAAIALDLPRVGAGQARSNDESVSDTTDSGLALEHVRIDAPENVRDETFGLRRHDLVSNRSVATWRPSGPRTEEQHWAGLGACPFLKRTDPETGPEHPARFGLRG